MPQYVLTINERRHAVNVTPDTPLLWVLRDALKMYGTKYGCGIAQCGACTVHVDGVPMRSCSLPVSQLESRSITTIEGLSEKGDHPMQVAWQQLDVPQCGYCQSGQIMTAAALLERIPNPTEEDIKRAMKGNLCRCGTYPRILQAIQSAARKAST